MELVAEHTDDSERDLRIAHRVFNVCAVELTNGGIRKAHARVRIAAVGRKNPLPDRVAV